MKQNLERSYEECLIDLFKVVSWFDNIRWRQEIKRPDVFLEQVLENNKLEPTQKILIHWLIYIIDRGKRADMLWRKNANPIKELVMRYKEDKIVKETQIEELCQKYDDKIKAFPSDKESIKRTLILLMEYNKDFIYFITRKLQEWQTPQECCPKVAYSLYLLSYADVGRLARSKDLRKQNKNKLHEKIIKTREILDNKDLFEEKFKKWYSSNKRWHKRLWAALRDYRKFKLLSEIFREGIRNNAQKEIWDKDFTMQLELPGDIWNTRFFEKCIKPIAKNLGISLRGKGTSEIVRRLHDKIKSSCYKSYPEQLDITFDFAPKMCDRKLCEICPFGPYGAERICIPHEGKYCPVALITCGYITKCASDNCAIKKGIGNGICKDFLR